jgi:hypothetical protein
MEHKLNLLVEDPFSFGTHDASYHSIQDGLNQQNEPNFGVKEYLEVSPLIVFGLKGVIARQGRSFEACNLTPT